MTRRTICRLDWGDGCSSAHACVLCKTRRITKGLTRVVLLSPCLLFKAKISRLLGRGVAVGSSTFPGNRDQGRLQVARLHRPTTWGRGKLGWGRHELRLLSKLRRNLWNFWDLVASVGCDRVNLQGMAGRGGTVGIMLRVSVRVLQPQRCPSRPAAVGTNKRNLTVLPNGDVCTVLERCRNVTTEECVVGNVGAWTERWDRRDITIIDHASRGGLSETDTKGRSAPDGGEAFEGTSPFNLLDRAVQLLLR